MKKIEKKKTKRNKRKSKREKKEKWQYNKEERKKKIGYKKIERKKMKRNKRKRKKGKRKKWQYNKEKRKKKKKKVCHKKKGSEWGNNRKLYFSSWIIFQFSSVCWETSGASVTCLCTQNTASRRPNRIDVLFYFHFLLYFFSSKLHFDNSNPIPQSLEHNNNHSNNGNNAAAADNDNNNSNNNNNNIIIFNGITEISRIWWWNNRGSCVWRRQWLRQQPWHEKKQ